MNDRPSQMEKHRVVRDFYLHLCKGYAPLRAALTVALPAALAMDNEPGALRFVLEQLRNEMQRRCEQYTAELGHAQRMIDEGHENTRLGDMTRFQIRQARTAMRLVEEYLLRVDALDRWAAAVSPFLSEVTCSRTDAATEKELSEIGAQSE